MHEKIVEIIKSVTGRTWPSTAVMHFRPPGSGCLRLEPNGTLVPPGRQKRTRTAALTYRSHTPLQRLEKKGCTLVQVERREATRSKMFDQ